MTQAYYGTGRRKEATARVKLIPGTGKIEVNGRLMPKYFNRPTLTTSVKQPMVATSSLDKFDVKANVTGGGISGQAGAVRHGIARALVVANSELRPILRQGGFLTRDQRM
ncbi:MAG: 30S ribosomal protein S9, partial [Endomicrobiia bacterium]|nr:30S ribosomal protein S9 [Endomicrobiia bacterium]